MMTRSEQLYKEAKQYLPGGVNSPVRAFGAVGDTPRFITRADAAYLWDEDGNRYIDYVGSWGPMLLIRRFGKALSGHVNRGLALARRRKSKWIWRS